MENKERFLEHLKRIGILENQEDLDRRMKIIPESSRKVLEARWGQDGGDYCHTYTRLNKKMGVTNSDILYRKAEKDLEEAKFAEILIDRDEFVQWAVAVNVGKLVEAVTNECKLAVANGKKVLELVDKLSTRESRVIYFRFGLDGRKANTLEQIAKIMGVSIECIRLIEENVLRGLRHPANLRKFYIPCQEEFKELKQFPEEFDIIDYIDISTRAYNCLKKADYKKLSQLQDLTVRDLMKIDGIGITCALEVYRALRKFS